MKKVILSLAVLASVALVSCDNKADNKDSESIKAAEAAQTEAPAPEATETLNNDTMPAANVEGEVKDAAAAVDAAAKEAGAAVDAAAKDAAAAVDAAAKAVK